MKAAKHFCGIAMMLFVLLAASTVQAQVVYPVMVNTNLRAPYSLNLSDYAAPGYDRIITNLYMSDITKSNYPVKLRLVIRGEGGVNLTTLPGQEVGPIYLNGGQTTTLTGSEINGLFNPDKLMFSGISIQQYRQNSALPEGLYQFQFEVIDYNLNVPISNSQVGFSTAWLILNDPPLINQPDRDVTIVPLPQQNIFFQWTPRHTGSPNSAFTTVYDLQMVEIYPATRNANDAMLTSPVIFEKTLYSTSYNYTLADPYLFPGKWYAFRVRAHDVDGRDFFKNQGYSEVYRFYYGGPCVVPANVKVTDVDAASAIVSWDAEVTHNTTEIQYKEKTASSWKKITSYSSSELIDNLESGTEYIFKLSGACTNNNSVFSDEVAYTTEGTSEGKECDLPIQESVTATAVTLTGVKVSWATQDWFTSYVFRYRVLGASEFLEVKSDDPWISLQNLDLDKIYEYQIRYLCRTGDWVDGAFNTFKTNVPTDLLTGGGNGDCFAPLSITHAVKSDFSVDISWEKDKESKAYVVYWRIKPDAGDKWLDSIIVSDNETTIKDLKPSTAYEYKIRSICKPDNLLSNSSDIKSFTSNDVYSYTGPCDAPKLRRPISIGTDEVKLDVEPKVYYTGYILEYRKSKETNWIGISVRQFPRLIEQLNTGTLYEYHVSSFCGLKQSDFSLVDTFTTQGKPQGEFVCGSPQGYVTITNRTPIAGLKEGDKFKAADFEVKVRSLTSSGPYNGKATAQIPYLKNSSFEFDMKDVMVNTDGQMYSGVIILKSANLRIIDEKLAGKISSFVDKVDNGLAAASTYLTMADSIQDALNDIVQTVNTPVDMDKYKGWTPEQLFEEGKRLVKEGQDLLKTGTPTSIAQAKQMIIEGIQLIKTAVAFGNSAVSAVGDALKDLLGKIRDKMKARREERLNENLTKYKAMAKNKEDYSGIDSDFSPIEVDGDQTSPDVSELEDQTVGYELTQDEISSLIADTPHKKAVDTLEKAVTLKETVKRDAFSISYLNNLLSGSDVQAFIDEVKTFIANDLLKLGQTAIQDTIDGKNPDLEDKITQLIDQKMNTKVDDLFK